MSTPAERHRHILKELGDQGFVKVAELSDELGVSEVTIRKDLRALEERKLLYRTHGGAAPTDPYVLDRPVDEKERERADQKRRIGRAAAELVEPGESVILASGTTVLEVARSLRTRPRVVVTSALNVALALRDRTETEVLLLGGMLRRSSLSVVGPYAEGMLREHSLTRAFLGVDGIDLEHGVSTTSALEAELNRAMMAAAQRTVVVADSTKFGRRGFRRICRLSEVDLLITDDGVPDAFVRSMEELGVEVRVA